MEEYLNKSKKEEDDGVKKIEDISDSSSNYDFSKLNKNKN